MFALFFFSIKYQVASFSNATHTQQNVFRSRLLECCPLLSRHAMFFMCLLNRAGVLWQVLVCLCVCVYCSRASPLMALSVWCAAGLVIRRRSSACWVNATMLLRVFALTWFASGTARLGGLLVWLGVSSLFPVEFLFSRYYFSSLSKVGRFVFCESHS